MPFVQGTSPLLETSKAITIQYTAVIIAYRRPDLVAAVLDSLATQTQPPRDVIVVDNGGTLTHADLTHFALSERIRLIPRADNPGYAAAVNEARGIDTDALLVLTHDADFDSPLAEGLLAALEADPSSGASAPVLHWSSAPERVFSAGGFLTRGGRGGHLGFPLSNRPYPVDWVDGAIVMYRIAALDSVDWISEDYFLYFEDVDTAWRMREAGFKTLIVPSTIARQEPGAHPMRLGIRNMTLFARKSGIRPLRQACAVARRVAEESAAAMLRGRRPHPVDAWRGWRDGRRGITGKPGDRE